jgi:hypothetical protein
MPQSAWLLMTKAKTLAQQKSDFTSEGSPLPGTVDGHVPLAQPVGKPQAKADAENQPVTSHPKPAPPSP